MINVWDICSASGYYGVLGGFLQVDQVHAGPCFSLLSSFRTGRYRSYIQPGRYLFRKVNQP